MLGDVFRAIARADLVVEVLDSREPDLTRSRYVEEKVVKMGKKLLIAINKGDLVPLEVLKGWKEILRGLRGDTSGLLGSEPARRNQGVEGQNEGDP
jgi:Predicted GTPases